MCIDLIIYTHNHRVNSETLKQVDYLDAKDGLYLQHGDYDSRRTGNPHPKFHLIPS